jgi:hypothetical protein
MPPGREREAFEDRSGCHAPYTRCVGRHDRLYVRARAEDLARWRQSAASARAPSLSAFVRDLLDAQPIAAASAAPSLPEAGTTSHILSFGEILDRIRTINVELEAQLESVRAEYARPLGR